MLNKYKANLIEMGIVPKREADSVPLLLNKNPLPITDYPVRLICGSGDSPRDAARAAIGEALIQVGGIDVSHELHTRISQLAFTQHINSDIYKYLCIVVLNPIEDEPNE